MPSDFLKPQPRRQRSPESVTRLAISSGARDAATPTGGGGGAANTLDVIGTNSGNDSVEINDANDKVETGDGT